jgi:hypothetical protein
MVRPAPDAIHNQEVFMAQVFKAEASGIMLRKDNPKPVSRMGDGAVAEIRSAHSYGRERVTIKSEYANRENKFFDHSYYRQYDVFVQHGDKEEQHMLTFRFGQNKKKGGKAWQRENVLSVELRNDLNEATSVRIVTAPISSDSDWDEFEAVIGGAT